MGVLQSLLWIQIQDFPKGIPGYTEDAGVSPQLRSEVRNADTRACLNMPNIFWKAKHLQIQEIQRKVFLAQWRLVGSKHKKVTAGDLLDVVKRDTIERFTEIQDLPEGIPGYSGCVLPPAALGGLQASTNPPRHQSSHI